MIRIKVNLHPPGGRFFIEKDGTKLSAGSWRGVIKRVVQYRKLNHRPPGDPEREVHEQACQRVPSLCYDDQGRWTPPGRAAVSLKARVLGWLAKLAKVTPRYVDQKTVAARAAVCLGCPAHGPMESGCSTCKRAVKELRLANLRGRKADARLTCCSKLGTDLQVATWLQEDRLNDPELPKNCWRRTEV